MLKCLLLKLLLFGALVGVSGSAMGEEEFVVKKVRYPEYDKDGRLSFEMMGDEAVVRPDGSIQIMNLVMVFYEGGDAVMRLTSPGCVFDRPNKTAVSTSSVCVIRSEVTLTGRGFEWRGNDGSFKINEDIMVVLFPAQDSDEEQR